MSTQEVEEKQPVKAINFLSAFSLTVGTIIGSGIFISVDETFKVTSSQAIGLVAIFWLTGGIISLIGGLAYAELGTKIPESGGERAYYKTILNEKFSRTFVITYAFITRSITLAAVCITAGRYLVIMVTPSATPESVSEKLFACAILFMCLLLNCISKTIATRAAIVFTVLKSLALLMIIGIGIYFLSTHKVPEWDEPFNADGFSILALAICLINVLWSFEGWNTLGLIAGDMKNPSRDLPLAICSGVITVTFFYILAVISFSATLGFNKIRSLSAIAVYVSLKVLKSVYPIIPLLVCCSAIGAAIGVFYSVSGLCMSAGYSGELPKIFSLVNRDQRTPIFSLFAITFIVLLFIPFKFQELLIYCAFYTWISYFLSLSCLIKLRFTKSPLNEIKSFKIPLVFVFLMQLVCLFVVGASFYFTPIGCSIFLAIYLFIFFVQFVPEKFLPIAFFQKIQDKSMCFLKNYCNLTEAVKTDVS